MGMIPPPATHRSTGYPFECHTKRTLIGISQGQRHGGDVESGIEEQLFGALDTLTAQPHEWRQTCRLPEARDKVTDRQPGNGGDLPQGQVAVIEAAGHELAGTTQRPYGNTVPTGRWGWPDRDNERLEKVSRQKRGRRFHVTSPLRRPANTVVVDSTCNLPAERILVVPHSSAIERRQMIAPRASQHEVAIQLHHQRLEVERGSDFPFDRELSAQHQGV